MINVYRCYNGAGLNEFAKGIGWHRIDFNTVDYDNNIVLCAKDDQIRAIILFMQMKPKLYEVHIAKTTLSVKHMNLFAKTALKILKQCVPDSNILGIIKKTNRAACIFAHRMGFKCQELGDYKLYTGEV